MRPNFAAFFQHVNIFGGKLGLRARFVVFLDEIGQMQRASQPRRPRANNQYIRFQLFSLYGHGRYSTKQAFGESRRAYFAFCSSSVSAGMISKMSPTTP